MIIPPAPKVEPNSRQRDKLCPAVGRRVSSQKVSFGRVLCLGTSVPDGSTPQGIIR